MSLQNFNCILGHNFIQCERLPKSKMRSSDDRFLSIVHVRCFGNKLKVEVCYRFIFTHLQHSLDLLVRHDKAISHQFGD